MRPTRKQLQNAQEKALELLKKHSGQRHEFFKLTKKRIYDNLRKINNHKEASEYLNHELSGLMLLELETEQMSDEENPNEVRTENMIYPLEESLRESIEFTKAKRDKYENLLNQENKLSYTSSNPKLNWNGQSNTLTFLFQQLKKLNTKEGRPFIGNSNEEVAAFLKNNFECYASTGYNTILGQMKNLKKPKKRNGSITIEI